MNTDSSLITMGRLGAPYGIKGWLWVYPETEYPDSLLEYAEWQIGNEGQWHPMTVEAAEMRPNGLVVKFVGIADRDEAAKLRSRFVAIPRTAFPEADDDEYYWTDLIGLTVVNLADEVLGRIDSLLETGANDIMVVIDEAGNRRLIPFVSAIVQSVDLQNRRIVADWGLDY